MTTVMDILATILPVFLTLSLGVMARKMRLLSREGVDMLKSVAVNITLPAVTLAALAQADYSPRNLLVPVWIFACCCLALALGFYVTKRLKTPGRLTPYLLTGFEGGMLGFSLYPMLYGTVAPFAIVDLGQVLFVFTVYKMLLSGARGVRGLAMEAVKSPSLWALAIGILIGSTGFYQSLEPSGVKGVLDAVLTYISAPTGFLILLAIGYDLRPSEVVWGRTLIALAMRVFVMGLFLTLTLLFNRFVLGGVMDVAATVLLFALPAPFVLPIFADDPNERGFIASTLSVMTVVTIAVFTVMVFVVRI